MKEKEEFGVTGKLRFRSGVEQEGKFYILIEEYKGTANLFLETPNGIESLASMKKYYYPLDIPLHTLPVWVRRHHPDLEGEIDDGYRMEETYENMAGYVAHTLMNKGACLVVSTYGNGYYLAKKSDKGADK